MNSITLDTVTQILEADKAQKQEEQKRYKILADNAQTLADRELYLKLGAELYHQEQYILSLSDKLKKLSNS